MGEKEFIKILDEVKDRIFRLSLHLLNNRPKAEDATQEIAIKMWNAKDKLETYDRPDAFAMLVTRNHCLDILKSKKNKITAETVDIINPANNPEKQAELNDEAKYALELMKALPEHQKSVIHLRDVEGYSIAEISEIIGITENNVRVQLSRARNSLKNNLQKIFTYEYRAS